MNSSDLNGRYVDTMLAGASQALDTELEKVWTDLSLVQPHERANTAHERVSNALKTYKDTLQSHRYPDQREPGTTFSGRDPLPELITHCGRLTAASTNDYNTDFAVSLGNKVSKDQTASEDLQKRLAMFEKSHDNTELRENDGSQGTAEEFVTWAQRTLTDIRGASAARIRKDMHTVRTKDNVSLPIVVFTAMEGANKGDPRARNLLSLLYDKAK